MKQSASHDSPNPLRRYLKETRFSLFHVQCTFISAFLLPACTWQRGLWSSKEICWILLRTKCSTQDLIAISCPLGSYWTVGSSCSQRGPVFGLLLPSTFPLVPQSQLGCHLLCYALNPVKPLASICWGESPADVNLLHRFCIPEIVQRKRESNLVFHPS